MANTLLRMPYASLVHSIPHSSVVEPGLHFSLDQYALFCMTIPSNQMQLALDQLDRDNKDWARRAKINKNAKRQLDVRGTVSPLLLKLTVNSFPNLCTMSQLSRSLFCILLFNRITCLY